MLRRHSRTEAASSTRRPLKPSRCVIGGLDHVSKRRKKLIGNRAVYHSMVEAQTEIANLPDGYCIINNHRSLFDGANTKDSDLGLVDDRSANQASINPRVCD